MEGLLGTSDTISSKEFQTYVDTRTISQKYPEIRAISAYYFPFSSVLEKPQPVMFSKTYGSEDLGLSGYEAFFDPKRHAAMQTALETGKVSITEKLSIAPNEINSSDLGFVMFVPLFPKVSKHSGKHRTDSLGWVSVTVRTADFMNVLGHKSSRIGAEIYCGNTARSDRVIFDSHAGQGKTRAESEYRQTSKLPIFNREWTIATQPLPEAVKSANNYRLHIIAVT
ncbi:MAG: hypothetical protein QG650_279 [Patescibacteria group bacterium]|nr:hypothetical protein [Patescibacteria group bacterium]